MTPKRTYTILWATIGLLLCLNLGTIGWIIQKTSQLRANRKNPESLVTKRLSFNPTQQTAYTAIRQTFLAGIRPHEDSLRVLRETLYGKLSQESTVSDDSLSALVSRMERQNGQIIRLRFRQWQQVRALCTPDQRVRFDQFLTRLGQGKARSAKPVQRERWRNQLNQ